MGLVDVGGQAQGQGLPPFIATIPIEGSLGAGTLQGQRRLTHLLGHIPQGPEHVGLVLVLREGYPGLGQPGGPGGVGAGEGCIILGAAPDAPHLVRREGHVQPFQEGGPFPLDILPGLALDVRVLPLGKPFAEPGGETRLGLGGLVEPRSKQRAQQAVEAEASTVICGLFPLKQPMAASGLQEGFAIQGGHQGLGQGTATALHGGVGQARQGFSGSGSASDALQQIQAGLEGRPDRVVAGVMEFKPFVRQGALGALERFQETRHGGPGLAKVAVGQAQGQGQVPQLRSEEVHLGIVEVHPPHAEDEGGEVLILPDLDHLPGTTPTPHGPPREHHGDAREFPQPMDNGLKQFGRVQVLH